MKIFLLGLCAFNLCVAGANAGVVLLGRGQFVNEVAIVAMLLSAGFIVASIFP